MSSRPGPLGLALAALASLELLAGAAAAADGDLPSAGSLEVVADPAPPAGDYLIGPEDVLEIDVLGVEDLSRRVRVSAQGRISLPLVGEMQVAGLSPASLESRLAGLLNDRYLQDAQVTVYVSEHQSRSFSILGAVEAPGRYPLTGPRTLLDVLSQAGGIMPEAAPRVTITRRAGDGSGDRRTLTVDLDALLYDGRTDLNLDIQEGDLIHVPLDLPLRIYVTGAVRNPGEIELRGSHSLSLLQAVTKAGGPTDRAALRRIDLLRRLGDGSTDRQSFDLRAIMRGEEPDPLLQDGDVVVVQETFF